MYNPIKTLKTNTIGTLNMLGTLSPPLARSRSCPLGPGGMHSQDCRQRGTRNHTLSALA